MATTKSNPSARCLDLTRLVSRVGRGPWSGIDRVEFEYLSALLTDPVPTFGLVRIATGFAILDQAGLEALRDRLTDRVAWAPPDWRAKLHRNKSDEWRKAESDVRRLALDVAPRWQLSRLLRRHLPVGAAYFNVGHSNLTRKVLAAVRSVLSSQSAVMIHDTIPLDWPHFQAPGTMSAFERKLRVVQECADLLICISDSASSDIRRHMSAWGATPEILVAHLGVKTAPQNPAVLPTVLTFDRPYFVILGTIEPRKNHTLLLDIWQRLGKSANSPLLVVVGQRGWQNQEVFDRLNANPDGVIELNGLSDSSIATLLSRSSGLLFPSFAEGFGLPAAEAAALGVPVICNDLPIFREILGDYPVYAGVADMYLWETKIKEMANCRGMRDTTERDSSAEIVLPTWAEHFNLVLNEN